MLRRFMFASSVLLAALVPAGTAHAVVPEPTACVTDYSMSSPAGYNITNGHGVVLGLTPVNRVVTLVRSGDLCPALPSTTPWSVTGPGFEASGTLADFTDTTVLVTIPASNHAAGTRPVTVHVGGRAAVVDDPATPLVDESTPAVAATDQTRSISVLRRTIWSTTDATPEPVRLGTALTVRAELARADWTEGEYAAYTGRNVRLQSRFYTSAWDDASSAGTDVTDARGAAERTVTADADRVWRFHYSGNSVSSHADARGDAVRLIRER